MSEAISYKEALKKGDKKGGTITPLGIALYMSSVKWDKEIEVPKTITLRTLGEIHLIVPPELPKGYQMERHPSWDNLAKSLYNPDRIYTNEYLFKLEIDLRDLRNLLGQDVQPGDLEDYLGSRYESYANWLEGIADRWYDLREDIQKLFCSVTGFPTSGGQMELPVANPPSLKETLQQMLDEVDRYEHEKRLHRLLELLASPPDETVTMYSIHNGNEYTRLNGVWYITRQFWKNPINPPRELDLAGFPTNEDIEGLTDKDPSQSI